MSKTILIIADTHFSDDRLDLFAKFVQKYADFADELYILGDLFNLYLGDDLINSNYQNLTTILRNIKAKVFIMRGNRDFLITDTFAKKTNTTIIDEPYNLKTKHKNYVLIHGDSLVADDKSYQRFKKIIQHPITKKVLNNLPKNFRTNLAGKISQKSQKSKQKKSNIIMDISENALFDFMQNYQNYDIIHGHTHRQNIHIYDDFKRFVLGDWKPNQGNFIYIKNDKIEIKNFN